VGEEGRGIPTIIEMVNHTRLDCLLGSAGLMRSAVAQATHHAAHRVAFGKVLADHDLMGNVLADLCVESEAATMMAMRLARAVDAAPHDREAALLKRVGVAVGKYWVCKSAVGVAAEALECLGGNGYVEESGMPRLYRETPLNSIWEGSGNVNALDVLRVAGRQPQAVEAYLAEVERARGGDRRLDAFTARLKDEVRPPEVADAFCASRLDGDWGRAFGTLPPGPGWKAIVERHRPRAG
jgi:putative acyl-CoA dehydrogenase